MTSNVLHLGLMFTLDNHPQLLVLGNNFLNSYLQKLCFDLSTGNYEIKILHHLVCIMQMLQTLMENSIKNQNIIYARIVIF